MSKKYLVLCLNSLTLEVNGGPSQAACNAVTGASWIFEFCQTAKSFGLEIISSRDYAHNPDHCVMLAESFEVARWPKIHDTICFNFESPLYLPLWFDAVKQNRLPAHAVRFGFPLTRPVFSTDQVCFPSYSSDQIISPAIGERSDLCVAVVSSKIVGMNYPDSDAFVNAFKASTQFARIQDLCEDDVEVFGRGWESADAFGVQSLKGKIVAVDDKLATLAKYKYAYAAENVLCPLYITEKPIEAIVAGCVPVASSFEEYQHAVPEYSIYGNVREAQKILLEEEETNPFSHKNAARVFGSALIHLIES